MEWVRWRTGTKRSGTPLDSRPQCPMTENGSSPKMPPMLPVSQMAIERAEYARPWKLLTLAAGIALLILGSFYYEAPDWDIPISLIMAALAYLAAPWSLRVLIERQWRHWPLMLFATWFTIDGSYWIYWHFKNPVALEMMRDANFLHHCRFTACAASSGCIAAACGSCGKSLAHCAAGCVAARRNNVAPTPLMPFQNSRWRHF